MHHNKGRQWLQAVSRGVASEGSGVAGRNELESLLPTSLLTTGKSASAHPGL